MRKSSALTTRNRVVVRATAGRPVFCRVALGAMVFAAVAAACEPADRAAESFFAQSCLLDTVSAACEDCIRVEVEARLGEDEEGEGYLEDRGTISAIVRDAAGSYWVGQREQVKVFDASGRFVHTVGRAGRGPLEFDFAKPMHTDRNGNVHVFDEGNRRVHVITDSLTLAEMRRLPASVIESQVALADSDFYAVAAWIPTPDHIGFPVHVVEDGAIARSFGVVQDSAAGEQVVDAFAARRWLAADADDNVYSAKHYDYVVEAWAEDGSRIGWLEGRALDDGNPRTTGPWAEDHPPWHEVRSIHVDASGYLWVILKYRRLNWFEAMEEVVSPSGRVSLRPKDGTLASYYHSRIDVVDLDRCAVVATTWYDGVLMQFIEDGLLSELDYGPLAEPVVNILSISLARAADGTREQNGAVLALHASRR